MHHRLYIVFVIGLLVATLLTGNAPAYAVSPATAGAVMQAAGAPTAKAISPQALVVPAPALERLLREEWGLTSGVLCLVPVVAYPIPHDAVVPVSSPAQLLYDLLRMYRC